VNVKRAADAGVDLGLRREEGFDARLCRPALPDRVDGRGDEDFLVDGPFGGIGAARLRCHQQADDAQRTRRSKNSVHDPIVAMKKPRRAGLH
jgi:hypothetical protein